MRVRARAFTLIELLVVIAIIAVLVAMLAPILRSVKAAVKQTAGNRAGSQLYLATDLYMADHDDVFPVAVYTVEYGDWQTWMGRQVGPNEFDPDKGIMAGYRKGKEMKDPAHIAEPYIGDMSGFGYNYGYIGSDLHVTGDYSEFPNCKNPARGTELNSPSTTIVYASSSFFNAPWYPEGDGQNYDFGFFDPPSLWFGNPNIDFRHFGQRKLDEALRIVRNEGRAVIVFADGSTKTMTQKQIKEDMFRRTQTGE